MSESKNEEEELTDLEILEYEKKRIKKEIRVLQGQLTTNQNDELNLKLKIARLELEINGYKIELEKAVDPNEKKELRDEIKTKENLLHDLNQLLLLQLKQSKSESQEEKTEVASLTSSIKCLELTESNQINGSSLWSSEFGGFGFLPTYVEFDPTNEFTLTQLLVPTQNEVNVATPLVISGEKMKFQIWGESEPDGIQDQIMNYCKNQSYNIFETRKKSMKSRGITGGIVTDTSFEDAYLKIGDAFLAVFEFKDSNTCIYANVAQAAGYASAFAITLLKRVSSYVNCIVPVVASNGVSIIFGATIILQESFPTYIPVSRILNLTNSIDQKIAGAYLKKLTMHCESLYDTLSPLMKNTVPIPMQIVVNDDLWVKTINLSTYQHGIGLFNRVKNDPLDIHIGIEHMITALNKIYHHAESRPFVVYPLSIRSPDKQVLYYQLIYPNLNNDGYQIGAPNRMDDEVLFDKYVVALKYAVNQIHNAGVIHCDLYLSNVMWKYEPLTQTVYIKIIDWDVSHTLDEGKFSENIKSSLCRYLQREPTFGVEHDLQYLKIFDLDKFQYEDDWINLASNNKPKIDKAFYKLFMAALNSQGR